MRKAMWKKGLSVAMAAAMLTGTVTVPAVFNNSAIVKAAEDSEQEGMPKSPTVINGYVYATVNLEYADFFYGELNNTAAGTSTTLDLSKDLLADYRAEGMYDAVTSATNTKSTKYATSYYETGVKNDEAETTGKDGNISNTNLYGIKEVRIAIPEALYNNLYAQKDGEYKNNKIYEYLNNATYSDTAFDTEYKVLNADGTFSKMITKEDTVEDTDANPVLTTSTTWGDYQIDIENLGVGDVTATTDNLYGIILTDKDGKNYGLLHSDNTWLQTQEFSWAVDDVFSVHGQNHVPYQRTNGLNAGNTITKITYLLKDSADIVINTNVKLKTLIDSEKVNGSAEAATYNANGTSVKFNFNNLPSDDYTLATLVKGARHGKTVDPEHWNYDAKTQTLSLDGSCVPAQDYVATFKSENYGDVKVTFAVSKLDQAVSVEKDAYTVKFGEKSFNLGAKATTALTYATSNDKVATVDENGNVTITGAGTAQITVTAQSDDYYNEAVKTVEITVNKGTATLTTKAKTTVNKAMGSKAFNLGAKATAGMKVSYASSDKKVATVSSNGTVSVKGTGIATITVTATGDNYNTVTKKITVKVAPKKQSVKVKAAKKKLTATWTKDKNATGYQLQIATNKNFKSAKTYTVTSYKTYKKTISKLKSKKTYYAKVRAYKTSGKTKVYGAYSAVKSCKVK